MAKVTIQDVAREAGVSIGTVYRAVNNAGRINEQTRQRVLATVERLGYKANTVARGLALRTKFNILVIMPQEPAFFWSDVIRGVRRAEAELSEYGVNILQFYHGRGPNGQKAVMPFIRDRKIDAIVLSTVSLEDGAAVLQYAAAQGIPAAIVNEDVASQERLFFYGPDNHLAGSMAAELLTKLCGQQGSCCIISSCSESEESTVLYRRNGFTEYIGRHGGDLRCLGAFNCAAGETRPLLERITREHPDLGGIYFANHEAMAGNTDWLTGQKTRFVTIGHEYRAEYEPLLHAGAISALLVQEKVHQGYYPVKMMHQYLVTGEKPARDHFYSNVNIIIGTNTGCLQYGSNGCGYE